VIAALVVCAVSITGAVALLVDMDAPFKGVIVVSADPMTNYVADDEYSVTALPSRRFAQS
jgi:hypothetical protein